MSARRFAAAVVVAAALAGCGPDEQAKPAHMGAFCPDPAATATTADGKPAVCRTSDTDDRNRWRTP